MIGMGFCSGSAEEHPVSGMISCIHVSDPDVKDGSLLLKTVSSSSSRCTLKAKCSI